MNGIDDSPEGAKLSLRVQPRSSRNELKTRPDGRLQIALTAPPVDDAANKAVCAFLADAIGIPKTAISVIHGSKSRDKRVLIRGVSKDAVADRLLPLCR